MSVESRGPEDERPIRTLVVDDSVVVRRFVTDRLASEPDFEIIGTASNGRLALRKIDLDPPDVVILDDEMPEMRGRDILKVVRAKHPTVAVVMFSGKMSPGALGTFDAMSLGADDGVAKPAAGDGPIAHNHPVWEELLRKARRCYHRQSRGGASIEVARQAEHPAPVAPAQVSPPPLRVRPKSSTGEAILVVASSTGGPDALTQVFSRLPADFPLPIVIAQHMPPVFTRLLAERLTAKSPILVREGVEGEPLCAGEAWIAPGDFHMTVKADHRGARIGLDQRPPENSCRPAADVLLRSVAESYGGNALVLVLSGMGQDGLLGVEPICAAGGHVIVQDEETCVVWGMPGAIATAGLADEILPINEIAAAVDAQARRLAGNATEVAS